jgi:ABC-type antimicrobial peptide transport system permease subunit
MSFLRLVLRGLWSHRRVNAAVLLGTALAVALLVGSLTMGASLRNTLNRLSDSRLGAIDLALDGGERLFGSDLAPELESGLGVPVAAALSLRGVVATTAGTRRVGGVRVLGVDARFFHLAPSPGPSLPPGTVAINRALAAALEPASGEPLVLRMERPGTLLRDAALARSDDQVASLRADSWSILDDEHFGRFGLYANQASPLTVFVPLTDLQAACRVEGRANLLLVGRAGRTPASERRATGELQKRWRLADVQHELRSLPGGATELRSGRYFLDPVLGRAASGLPGASGILTYLVDGIAAGSRETPYSMVAALGDVSWIFPNALADDEILINEWLSSDLRVGRGDSVELSYRRLLSGRGLAEERRRFRVRAVLPMEGAAVDAGWTPSLPGMTGAAHCRDWSPGLELDLDRIRSKDEAYWQSYGMAPKAFVSLAAGREMWGSLFGDLTAVRVPGVSPGDVFEALKRRVDVSGMGLYFRPVRSQAEAAAESTTDFGALFTGFNSVLLGSSFLLVALLFALGVEDRASEIGLLTGVGFRPGRIRLILMVEAAFLVPVGGLLGSLAGGLYARLLAAGLSTIWRSAAGGERLQVVTTPAAWLGGWVGGVLAVLVAIIIASRAGLPPARLFAGDAPFSGAGLRGGRVSKWLGIASWVLVVPLALNLQQAEGRAALVSCFGAGALFLIGGLLIAWSALGRARHGAQRAGFGLARMALRNVSRTPGRSLATVALLAAGSFLVAGVTGGRSDARDGANERESGTGGFDLMVDSSVAMLRRLDDPVGQLAMGLDPRELRGVRAVPFRVREGDEASCLNLNRPQVPTILGVKAAELHERGAFRFLEASDDRAPWLQLEKSPTNGDGIPEVPAIGDQQTITWALHKRVGEVVELGDDRGRPLRLRLVGMLGNSVLQGALVIDESSFLRHFPASSGYRSALLDVPPGRRPAVARELRDGLADMGGRVTPTPERLKSFLAVEDTYLSIFTLLGGLGMALACLGVGIFLLRNVVQRRGELALLSALGYSRRRLRTLLLLEQGGLLTAGLVLGSVAALVALIPALGGHSGPGVVLDVSLGYLFLLVSGVAWTAGAAWLAMRWVGVEVLRQD